MPYSDREYKVSNVNYINKDFSALKNTLIEYAKTYFPNTYRDFNETSPGMMLIEMSAYIGDVLSFYIDEQYKEMMLPLAEEKRNVINIANMLGYKVKPITPSYVDLTFTQTVGTTGDINNYSPDYANDAFAVPKGLQVKSTTDSSIIFETLDVVDFTVSSSVSYDINTVDANGVVSDFKLTRKVRAISGETKTKTFTIGVPQKFLKLTLSETNVIDIIKITDSNGNRWYETDFIAQDFVPTETHYSDTDSGRISAYSDGTNIIQVPAPYTLQYLQTGKRFITEVNDDNTVSLIFGNGVLRSGQDLETSFIQLDQVGIIIPGEESEIDVLVDPINFTSNTNTLGEAPAHVTLTVEYRIGGGISTNVPSGDITNVGSFTAIVGSDNGTLTATNESPARGGSSGETVEEIRRKAKAFFATQNRCVTKEDYEARILAMPAKFGNIAKVFVDRTTPDELYEMVTSAGGAQQVWECTTDDGLVPSGQKYYSIDICNASCTDSTSGNPGTCSPISGNFIDYNEFISMFNIGTHASTEIPTISAYILSYDNNKNLVVTEATSGTTHPLKTNLKNYLNQYRIITDEIQVLDGKIINFGVVFDIVAHKSSNKVDVKLRCINKIKEYFTISKMQFHQPIYTSDLEYELMSIEGVRSVNSVKLTQDFDTDIPEISGTDKLWDYNMNNQNGGAGTSGYGWQYDFSIFYGSNAVATDGVVLPSVTPSVFELKKPNDNIKGVVR